MPLKDPFKPLSLINARRRKQMLQGTYQWQNDSKRILLQIVRFVQMYNLL